MKKKQVFILKNAQILGVEILKKNSITFRKYTVTYCQTLKEAV